MRTLTRILATAALCAPAMSAAAQSLGDIAAYVALAATPTAGVAPIARPWMSIASQRGVGVDAQWGHMSVEGASINTFTGGVTVPIASGRGDVGISAGYFSPSCDGGSCDGNFVAGGVAEGRVLQSQMQSATFTLGLSGRVGFAKPSGGSLWSASVGAPLSLAIGGASGLQVVPFITPAFGWGHASGGGVSESGSRLMLGGGIGLLSASSGLGFNVGAQKVFIDGGKTVIGAGFSWSRR